jgi:hypothetical protein
MRLAFLIVFLGACGSSRELAPIWLEPVNTYGASQGEAAMSTWPRVSAHHPGGFRVLIPQPGGVPALPLVFSDEGAFLGTLGTRDEGPGQFIEPLFTKIGPGDSLWIFDGASRVQVFGPDRVWARSIALPVAPWDAVIFNDGRMVIASGSYGQPLPVHLLDTNGKLVRSIGGSDAAGSPSPRRITRGLGGTFWLASMTHRFQVEQWDTSGTPRTAIQDVPEWFEAYDSLTAPTAESAPQPAVQDLWVDERGRVWVLGRVADPKWATGLGDANTGTGGVASIEDPDRVFDTVIDVFDGQTGIPLTNARVATAYPFLAGPGVLMRVVTPSDGWQRAELAQVMVDASRLPGGP